MDDQIIDYNETTDEAEVEAASYGIGNLRMSLRERPRKDSISRKLRDRSDTELRFLCDFDPENSEREKRKSKRKVGHSASFYDEYGNLRYNDLNICDCMSIECPGCFYDCEKCGSNKCGVHCRVNRRFFYESMSFDGKDKTIVNPHMRIK